MRKNILITQATSVRSFIKASRHLGGAKCAHALRPALQVQRRGARIATTSNYRREGGSNSRRSKPIKLDSKTLLELALPTLGFITLASVVAPILGGLVVSAIGVGIAIAAVGAALSLSWVLIPFIIPFIGVPLLIGGGIFAGLFAIPALIQLAVIAGGLGLGAWVARTLLFDNVGQGFAAGPPPANKSTIDVEAETVEDWVSDIEKESRRREQELREFDEILRRRDKFRNGGS